MRERDVERVLRTGVEKAGGKCYKWVSPGTRGVPDRIVILPGGRIHFVELKTDDGRAAHVQAYMIRKLRDLGCTVYVLKGCSDVRAYLREVVG